MKSHAEFYQTYPDRTILIDMILYIYFIIYIYDIHTYIKLHQYPLDIPKKNYDMFPSNPHLQALQIHLVPLVQLQLQPQQLLQLRRETLKVLVDGARAEHGPRSWPFNG